MQKGLFSESRFINQRAEAERSAPETPIPALKDSERFKLATAPAEDLMKTNAPEELVLKLEDSSIKIEEKQKAFKELMSNEELLKIVSADQLNRLLKFVIIAENSVNTEKNILNISHKIRSNTISPGALTANSIRIILEFWNGKEGGAANWNIRTLMEKAFLSSSMLVNFTVQATGGNLNLLDHMLWSIGKNPKRETIISWFSAKSLEIIINNHPNGKSIISELNDKQKAGLLNTTISENLKDDVFTSLLKTVKDNINKFEEEILRETIDYCLAHKPEEIKKLTSEGLQKISAPQAKVILLRFQSDRKFYSTLLNNINAAGFSKTLIEDKTFELKIRRDLYNNLEESARKNIQEPKSPNKVIQTEAKTESAILKALRKNPEVVYKLLMDKKILPSQISLNIKLALLEKFTGKKIQKLLNLYLIGSENPTEWIKAVKNSPDVAKYIFQQKKGSLYGEDLANVLNAIGKGKMPQAELKTLTAKEQLSLLQANSVILNDKAVILQNLLDSNINKAFSDLELNEFISYIAKTNYADIVAEKLDTEGIKRLNEENSRILIEKLYALNKVNLAAKIIQNLNDQVKAAFINSASTTPEILALIDPKIGETIKRFNLVYIDGQLRRKSRGTRAEVWMPGYYKFVATDPGFIYYVAPDIIRKTALENHLRPEDEWMPVVKAHTTAKDDELLKEKYTGSKEVITTRATTLYNGEKPEVKIANGVREEHHHIPGSKNCDIPAGEKLTIISDEIRIFNGRKHVEVQYHKRNTTGWVELAMIEPQKTAPNLDAKTKAIYEKYLIEFDSIRLSERKIELGNYQLQNRTTSIYQETGETRSNQFFRFFQIKDPRVFEVKEGDETFYFVKAENFQHYGTNGKLETTTSKDTVGGNLPGYVNINYLIKGHEITVEKPETPKLTNSEWNKEPNFKEYDKVTPGEYGLKKATRIYGINTDQPHQFEGVSRSKKVEIVNEKIRLVEGQEYVKVKIKDTDQQGWMPLADIDIPLKERLYVTPEKADEPEEKYELRSAVWSPENGGKIKFRNRREEVKTRLKDIFPAKDGDKIVITGKSTGGRPKTAVYIEKDGKYYDPKRPRNVDNFYFIDSGGKVTKRALVWSGDTVVWVAQSPETTPKGLSKGTYEVHAGQSGTELLEKLYKIYPDLKDQISKAGLTEGQYLQQLLEPTNRKGNTINVIWPTATINNSLARLQKEVDERSIAYSAYQAKESTRILNNSQHFLNDKFPITNPKLLEYFDSDTLWNNIWLQKDTQANEYINGIERVISILTDPKTFNLSKEEIRDKLRNLVQRWSNKEVDFADVFEFFGAKLYGKGDFGDFKKELESSQKTVKEFTTQHASFLKIVEEHAKKFDGIQAKWEAAKAQGREQEFITNNPEYKDWKASEQALMFAGATPPGFNKEYNDYVYKFKPAVANLHFMANNVMRPIAQLLEAISEMEIRTSIKTNQFQKIEETVSQLKEVEATFREVDTFISLSHLQSNKDGYQILSAKQLENLKNDYAIRPSDEVVTNFNTVATSLDATAFEQKQVLKTLFKLYSLETLVNEGCLKRVKGKPQQLLLTKLPENFTKDNAEVKALFKQVENGDQIDSKTKELEKIRAIIDKNIQTLEKLSAIFGTGPEITRHLHKLDVWNKWMSFEYDTREFELTMEGIAGGDITLPSGDFMKKYMSPNAARGEMISTITRFENGVEIYDSEILRKALRKRLEVALDSLNGLAYKIPGLTELKNRVLGPNPTPASINSKFESLATYLDNFLKDPNAKLTEKDSDLIALLHMGHVMGRIFEEGRQQFKYSDSLEIKKIQQAMIKASLKYSQEDIDKVEQIFLGGIAVGADVGSNGTTFGGVGIGTTVQLGDGWSMTLAMGASLQGISGGVTVEKQWKISKDGRTAFTLGLDTGYLYVGGHMALTFPVGAKASATVSGGGGIIAGCPVLFYAGGGLSIRKDTNFEQREAFKKFQEEVGFDAVNKLIAKGAATEQIVSAIMKLPKIGPNFFQKLQRKYNLTNAGILELYTMKKDQFESLVTTNTSTGGFDIIGAGVYAGVIAGVPIVAGYIEIKIGEEIVVARRPVPGHKQMDAKSELKVQREILKQIGKSNANFLTEITHETGQYIYDAITGQPAILEGSSEANLDSLHSIGRLNKNLNSIKAGASYDQETKLTRLHFGDVKGNLQIIVDPAMKTETRDQIVIHDNKILLASDLESHLFITREDFYYPLKKDGEFKLTRIIIKENPLRKSTQIAKESGEIVYQRPGYLPEIRKGIATTALAKELNDTEKPDRILTYAEYESRTKTADTQVSEHLDKYNEFRTNIDSVTSTAQEARKGIIPETLDSKAEGFAAYFYNHHFLQYKQLSTQKGGRVPNSEKLVQMIQKSFAKYGPKHKLNGPLTDSEMQKVLTYLMIRSFAQVRGNEKQMQRNLEFGRQVLNSFFKGAIKKIEKENPGVKIEHTAEQMTAYIIDTLKQTDINGQPDFLKPGTAVLSVVGTNDIVGLRGVPSYGSTVLAGILNHQKYSLTGVGIEKSIARVILQLTSPLGKENKEFMRSALTLKLLTHPGMFFILGQEDALKVSQCFRDKEVSKENKEAFEKFKKIVLDVRQAQMRGQNFIELSNKYRIVFNTEAGMGVFNRCANPTMTINEDIVIMAPRKVTTAGVTNYVRLNANLKRKDLTFLLGFKVSIFGGEPPPPETPETPEPTAEPEGGVDVSPGVPGQQPKHISTPGGHSGYATSIKL